MLMLLQDSGNNEVMILPEAFLDVASLENEDMDPPGNEDRRVWCSWRKANGDHETLFASIWDHIALLSLGNVRGTSTGLSEARGR